jgi:predicted phage terminase large subunit-like protein
VTLSLDDLNYALRNIEHLDPGQKARVLDLLDERERLRKITEAREHFLPFVKLMWPSFIAGAHHTIMAEAFDKVANGQLNRLAINMPPRHTKSEFASWLLPAWFLGRFPSKKVIQASNTEALAAGFGRRVRNLIGGEYDEEDEHGRPALAYSDVFPGVTLAKDSQAAAGWHTNRRGEYFAIGVNGKVTGKGGDLIVIDDPHALEINTPIPTPKGFVAVQDLRAGDEVFGPDGKPTRVLAKSSILHDRELYAVTTDDRQTVLCDGGHLWTYRSDTKLKAPMRTATTRELAAWSKASKPCLPRHAPVEYPEAALPIDPWVLGAWLGDGTSSLGRITAHPNDAPYMRGEFEKAGYTVTDLVDRYSFGVLRLRAQLIAEGLLNNKRVPEVYLQASVKQRMALLQGLIDTDGNITEAGQCAFHNSNRGLVESVIRLLHSLGVKAKLSQYEDLRGRWKSAKTKFRVTFKLKDAARMPRKAVRSCTPTDKRSRSITVSPAGETGSVQCITVDRPDGLFLAGRGYIVTHNSEQEAKQAESSPEIYDGVYNWYTSGPRQRLQPGGAVVLVQTRWSKRDLTGQVIKRMQMRDGGTGGDNWTVIELPAILDRGEKTERSLWPGYWKLPELKATLEEIGEAKFSAQYQQKPTSEQGAILKRELWKKWGHDTNADLAVGKSSCPSAQHAGAWAKGDPPACDFIIHSWDTAQKKTERADYTAMTSWGVFKTEALEIGEPLSPGDESVHPLRPRRLKTVNNLILLSAYKERLSFPELKARIKQFYDEDTPDTLLIEDKGSGISLIQEFRSMGIPVENFSYGRGSKKLPNDKIARANLVTDIFASGYVWAPETRFAEAVIEECGEFPNSEHDDYVDTVVQALLRFRTGGFIRTANDEEDVDNVRRFRRKRYY